jgi:hypothetical protein
MKMNERIRSYIVDNGLKFSFVAQRVKMDDAKFSRIITGKQKINTDEYEIICTKGLNVHPSFFYADKFLETKKKSA